ncbi:cystatin-like [Clarias gariepinus]|uniref:cystatin-like n=1 Tax=Clarias gariepinus TaxID=13013 RepID=UPI00234C8317|nr:cystatin-like [Clarias gariepinus]
MLVKVVVPVLVLVFAVTSQIIVGGLEDADINDPDIKQALQFAVAEYNVKSNSIYTSKVIRVISAQKQIVSGIKYIITVKMATTSCKKTLAKKKCPVHSKSAIAKPRTCEFAVWSQPWLNRMELVENTC